MNTYNQCIAKSQPNPDWTGCGATRDTCLSTARYNTNMAARAKRDGKIIANKRDELTAILARFSINADSPLTILTQDTAKTFLTSNTESDFYKVRRAASRTVPTCWN